MDDQNKKNHFDDFFPQTNARKTTRTIRHSHDERIRRKHETGDGGSNESSKSSYYYSTGLSSRADQNPELNVQPGADEPGGQVEVTPPQQAALFRPNTAGKKRVADERTAPLSLQSDVRFLPGRCHGSRIADVRIR